MPGDRPGPGNIAWGREGAGRQRQCFSASGALNESDHIRVGSSLTGSWEEGRLLGVLSQLNLLPDEEVRCHHCELRVPW